MALWKKVFIGLLLGIVLGLTLKDKAVYLKPLGDIFIRLIKMVIVPLIFVAIVTGISNVQDSKLLGRVGVKAAFTYIMTTMFAVTIGLLVGSIFKPGEGSHLHFATATSAPGIQEGTAMRIMDALVNVIPDNAIGAMAQGTVLQVVFFSLFTGFTMHHLDQNSSLKLRELFMLFSKLIFKMVGIIIEFSPVAACCLTAWVIGTQGLSIVGHLLDLIACAMFAFGLQYIVFAAMLYGWARLSPIPFFRKSLEYQLIAFSTSSSKATLPTTMSVCQERLGVSAMSSSFVLSLGASINMDGIAIYVSLCTLFFAQAMGVVLLPSDYLVILIVSTLGSIGGAGIPGGSLLMLPMVLAAVGLPVEGIALIAGIDRILDMMRTALSITGDATVALCIDKSEGLFDEAQYYRE